MRKIIIAKRALLSLLVAINFTFISDVASQCNFNCIDTINVSVNNLCMATIRPSMVLSDFDTLDICNYGIQLFDANGDVINLDVSRADIGPQYVGQTLKIRIFDADGSPANSCWGYIKVEDKLPPDIMCVGNDTLECYLPDIFADEAVAKSHLENIIENNLVDNCGNEEVIVNITKNVLTRLLCQGEFAAMRVVGYNVLNNNFDITSCEDTIYYRRFELDSLDAPKNYTGNMSIDCTEPYPSIEYLIGKDSESPGNNSLPNINGTSIADYADSLFTERGLCNFKLVANDLIFETCGNTYKIVRTWTVIDWCSSNAPKIFNQVIKIIDDNIIQNSISNKGPFGADKGKCDALVELPLPTVSPNECNDWTFTITIREPGGLLFFPFGGIRDTSAALITRRFPIGTSRVRYIVEDLCLNVDTVEFDVTVEDQEAPIPVCDSRTVVTLNGSFLGKVFAKSFDDGSYDHCSGIASYKVRRLDRLTTNCPTPQDFDDFVKFCCEDIGKTIMVELQVTDGAGYSSICMAEAQVQYKGLGPAISCAPEIGIQSCDSYENFNINSLVAPTISSSNPCLEGNLVPLLRESGRSIDVCGDGYIDIEWYWNLTGEEEILCSERIVFSNLDPFTLNDINWPADRTVNSCNDLGPTVDELSNIIGGSSSCNNVVASEPVDKLFDNVPGKCLFILRTWTVVDWCRYPANPNARWTYEQKIDVINNIGPVVNIDESNISILPNPDSCRALVSISGIASDDCTPENELSWTYRLDLIRDGLEVPLVSETNGNFIEVRLDAGDYILTWTATDGCGNTSLERQSFTIEDDLVPNALCGFVIQDIDNTGNVLVTSIELNNGSTDNCGDELTILIRKEGDLNNPTSQLNFTCADIGVNNVELWVTDQMGNSSMCIAAVDIRDGLAQCGFGASVISLDGTIKTEENIAVESAMVELNIDDSMVELAQTKVDGQFNFANLNEHKNYSLKAYKNEDYLNGISTLDIVLMQRHILGIQTLESPYKLIAADVDNSQSISAVDMVVLRRMILGHIEEFPDSDSWRIIDKNFKFIDASHPWPLFTGIDVGQLANSTQKELLAIKIGDLNSTAIANSSFAGSRSASPFHLYSKTKKNGADLVYTVYAAKNINALGYQIAFDFDDTQLDFMSINSELIGIVDEMVNVKDGNIKLSVASARPSRYYEGDALFTITFRHKSNGTSQDLPVVLHQSNDFSSEIYSENLESQSIILKQATLNEELILYQNRPNPFSSLTFIDFEIPKSEEVTFELFDINGSRVYSFKENYSPGRHQISLNREDIGLNKGIYYYQIHSQQRSLIRKMIIL